MHSSNLAKKRKLLLTFQGKNNIIDAAGILDKYFAFWLQPKSLSSFANFVDFCLRAHYKPIIIGIQAFFRLLSEFVIMHSLMQNFSAILICWWWAL